MVMEDTEWLTVDEAAKRIKISKSTMRRYVAKEKITAFRPQGGRDLRFRASDVDALMQPIEVNDR